MMVLLSHLLDDISIIVCLVSLVSNKLFIFVLYNVKYKIWKYFLLNVLYKNDNIDIFITNISRVKANID